MPLFIVLSTPFHKYGNVCRQRDGAQIVLRNVKHSAESVESEVLETHGINGINGTNTVISADSPIFACYFYLH